jgi:hypothetical protein
MGSPLIDQNWVSAMEKTYGRGLTLVACCLALIGAVAVVASTIASDGLYFLLLVGGSILVALGAAIYLVCQLRNSGGP